jgi:hypothetical protein
MRIDFGCCIFRRRMSSISRRIFTTQKVLLSVRIGVRKYGTRGHNTRDLPRHLAVSSQTWAFQSLFSARTLNQAIAGVKVYGMGGNLKLTNFVIRARGRRQSHKFSDPSAVGVISPRNTARNFDLLSWTSWRLCLRALTIHRHGPFWKDPHLLRNENSGWGTPEMNPSLFKSEFPFSDTLQLGFWTIHSEPRMLAPTRDYITARLQCTEKDHNNASGKAIHGRCLLPFTKWRGKKRTRICAAARKHEFGMRCSEIEISLKLVPRVLPFSADWIWGVKSRSQRYMDNLFT